MLLAWTLRRLLRVFHELDTKEINHTRLDYPEHEITDGNAQRNGDLIEAMSRQSKQAFRS
jgi:hypothetical protein